MIAVTGNNLNSAVRYRFHMPLSHTLQISQPYITSAPMFSKERKSWKRRIYFSLSLICRKPCKCKAQQLASPMSFGPRSHFQVCWPVSVVYLSTRATTSGDSQHLLDGIPDSKSKVAIVCSENFLTAETRSGPVVAPVISLECIEWWGKTPFLKHSSYA